MSLAIPIFHPHLTWVNSALMENIRRKYSLMFKARTIRESSGASCSPLVGCSGLKVRATSCLCKACYCWAHSKQKSMERLQGAQKWSFQVLLWTALCESSGTYFGSLWVIWGCRKILRLLGFIFCSRSFLYQISLWAVTMHQWEQKKRMWRINPSVLQIVPRLFHHEVKR